MSHTPIYQTSSAVVIRRPLRWRIATVALLVSLLIFILVGLILGPGTETMRANTNIMPVVVSQQISINQISNALKPEPASSNQQVELTGQVLSKTIQSLLTGLNTAALIQPVSKTNVEPKYGSLGISRRFGGDKF